MVKVRGVLFALRSRLPGNIRLACAGACQHSFNCLIISRRCPTRTWSEICSLVLRWVYFAETGELVYLIDCTLIERLSAIIGLFVTPHLDTYDMGLNVQMCISCHHVRSR